MTTSTNDLLDRIGRTDEIQIATPGDDGMLRDPVPVWVVRHGDALYVRSYRGRDGAWWQRATDQGHGRISANGVDTDVTFTRVTDDDLDAEIDAAYRDKYGRYGPRYLEPMVSPAARATTLKLVTQPTRR